MIDWTKPLELMDGAPVELMDEHQPDRDGDYWIVRSDGENIVSVNENAKYSSYHNICVKACGCEQGTYFKIVRNVQTDDTHTLYGLDLYAMRIRQWANNRNLIEGATSQAQTVKLFEEGGEVAHAVARGDRDKLKDGIGDMVVVLTILAAQNGLTLDECVAAAYDEIKGRTGRMVDGVFVRDA